MNYYYFFLLMTNKFTCFFYLVLGDFTIWYAVLGTNNHLSVEDTINVKDLVNLLIRPHLNIYVRTFYVCFNEIFSLLITLLLVVEIRQHLTEAGLTNLTMCCFLTVLEI